MKTYIGVDVSKAKLDVDWQGHPIEFLNTDGGMAKLIEKLQTLHAQKSLALVVCEASGGYEQKLIKACHLAELPIHVAHANKVRAFARSKGVNAKTDRMDASMIGEYARVMQIQPDTLQLSENAEKIRLILKRREQLLADKKRETNRSDKIEDGHIRDSIDGHVKWLKDEIDKLDKQLDVLNQAQDIKAQHELLTSVPAIGSLIADYLLAYLPELGKLSPKAIAALVGVAPFNRDSGTVQGKRFIQGGRSTLRRMLYMAALASIRWNADMQVFYQRLRNTGKPAKVAIVAIMRKLVSLLNSIMRRQSPWQKSVEISANLA